MAAAQFRETGDSDLLVRLFTRLRFGLVLKYRRRLSVIQRHFDPELRGYIRWLSPIRRPY